MYRGRLPAGVHGVEHREKEGNEAGRGCGVHYEARTSGGVPKRGTVWAVQVQSGQCVEGSVCDRDEGIILISVLILS